MLMNAPQSKIYEVHGQFLFLNLFEYDIQIVFLLLCALLMKAT